MFQKPNGTTSALIRNIYAAADDPNRWSTVLEQTRIILNARITAFLVSDKRLTEASIGFAVGEDQSTFDEYSRHWATQDPWLTSQHELLRTHGATYDGALLVEPDKVKKTAFFNEFFLPRRLDHSLSATVEYNENVNTYLTSNYDSTGRAKDGERLEIIRTIVPHLQQALKLHRKLREAELDSRVRLELIERTKCGVVVFRESGKVLQMNREAERILALNDGLSWKGSRVTADYTLNDQQMQRAAAIAKGLAQGKELRPVETVRIDRKSGKPPLFVQFVPITGQRQVFGTPSFYLMLIVDSERPPGVPESWLVAHFGLTKTEARVAVGLVGDVELPELAQQYGMALETLRSHIKKVYLKCGVRNRSGLVNLLRALEM
jgi:DNA-binding CsgD family transcriptional regulator